MMQMNGREWMYGDRRVAGYMKGVDKFYRCGYGKQREWFYTLSMCSMSEQQGVLFLENHSRPPDYERFHAQL